MKEINWYYIVAMMVSLLVVVINAVDYAAGAYCLLCWIAADKAFENTRK